MVDLQPRLAGPGVVHHQELERRRRVERLDQLQLLGDVVIVRLQHDGQYGQLRRLGGRAQTCSLGLGGVGLVRPVLAAQDLGQLVEGLRQFGKGGDPALADRLGRGPIL